MEDLQFPWLNLHDHDHQEQIFDFDSENMFYNPIHQLSPTNWGDQEIPTDLVYNNGFRSEIKNSSLLSGTNSSIDGSDGISIILSNSKGLKSDNIIVGNNNISGVSSGDSVDDGVVSKCSSRKRLISQVEVSDNDYNKLVNLNPHKQKRSRSNTGQPVSSNINFQQPGNQSETDTEAIAQMKEMIYREAAFRPVNLATEILVEKPKRKNVRISSDPQTVAARQRRERISERIRVLQKLVPGGNKMDTASMLDEAANYLKFLRSQVNTLEQIRENGTIFNAHGTNDASQISHHHRSLVVPFTQNPFSMQTHFSFAHENLYPNEGRV